MKKTFTKAGFTLAEVLAGRGTLPPVFSKAGFTLAEVLITLGIIGIVAAITIPNLIQKNYEKQTVAKLLETQSILSQAIRLAEEEYGEMGGWNFSGDIQTRAVVVAEHLKPFLKVSLDCGTLDDNAKCFADSYQLFNGTSHDYARELAKYKLALMNGSAITLQYERSLSMLQINIDVNGVSKPNVVGKDVFLFYYDVDARSLLPMGAPGTLYPADRFCLKQSQGWGCAYYVIKNKDMRYLYGK